jgi:hypothetical protein
MHLLLGRNFEGHPAPPHWSICHFSLPAGKLKELISVIDPYRRSIPMLGLQTGPLCYFEKSGAAYLSISEPEHVLRFQQEICNALKTRFSSLKRNMAIPSVPHLTLGRGISNGEALLLKRQLKENPAGIDFGITELRLMMDYDGKRKPVHHFYP